MKSKMYLVGSEVKYTVKHLKGIGLYVGVPKKGSVVGHSDLMTSDGVPYPIVLWEGRQEPTPVHPGNLMPAKAVDVD